jgi:hypothetical protein
MKLEDLDFDFLLLSKESNEKKMIGLWFMVNTYGLLLELRDQ